MGENALKAEMLARILWLADLAVTYMGSDPVRAWDRVMNLYDELNLPKLEAEVMARTDAFFDAFAEDEIFRQIIGMKHFPYIFRQRWNLIYRFFHEGNPSTKLNRTIATARKLYLRVNLEIGMGRGELLQSMATDNWAEYFIGIGRDQNGVFRAKSRFTVLDPQNASAFWGDAQKLLPAISDASIDNFLMVLPENSTPIAADEGRSSFRSMVAILTRKLARGGSLRILTDLDGAPFRELVELAGQAGLQQVANEGKTYFPKDWRDPEFKPDRKPQILVLAPK
jgi:tRNA G46 methylase TrmB